MRIAFVIYCDYVRLALLYVDYISHISPTLALRLLVGALVAQMQLDSLWRRFGGLRLRFCLARRFCHKPVALSCWQRSGKACRLPTSTHLKTLCLRP